MRRSRSSVGIGHARKCAAKVCARTSLVSRLWLVEWIDQFGGRLGMRLASTESAVALDYVDVPVSSRQRTPCRQMSRFAAIAGLN
jgi:hypothetical protein